MIEAGIRECRICGLEKECRKGRRECKDCAREIRREHTHRSGKHIEGRQRNHRQRREIQGVLDGKNSWVTCSECRQMKRFQPTASGKGKGWRSLVCPDCTAQYMAEWRAAKQAEWPRFGPCSKCGAEGEYANGLQCKACFRAHQNDYSQTRRKGGKDGWRVYLPAHSRICKRCRNRCRIAGFWRGETCPVCCQKDDKATAKRYRKELRERMVSAGEWTCSQCHQVQPVEDGAKGWLGQKCPPCSRAYQRQRYHQKLKHNPEYRRKKLAASRAYEQHRSLARKEAESGGAGSGNQVSPTYFLAQPNKDSGHPT